MLIGNIAGLGTCALWGFTFVASRTIAPFTTWDLTVCRYGLFGLTSLALMLHPRLRPIGLSRRQWTIGFLVGLLAAPGYFVSAAFAVQLAGAAIPPLIVGVAPVLLAIIANRRDRSLPWRRLAWPLGLIVVGLVVVNLDVLWTVSPTHGPAVVLGIALSLVALVTWVAFGMINVAVMQAPDAPDGLHWTGLQGLGAGVGALLLLPMTSSLHGAVTTSAASLPFWGWVILMGIMGSWVATWLWVIASRTLPLALLSQLIVAETVFGLLYGFIYEQRWPSAGEAIGAALQLSGVVVAIAMFTRRDRSAVLGSPAAPAIVEPAI